MAIKQQKRWRRINPYVCAGCGRPRMSFVYGRAKEAICMSCRKSIVPDNQQALFAGDYETK